jgi:hypothetical protein
MLDFMLLDGNACQKQFKKIDQNIRGAIDRELKIRGLPIECRHASWLDGGLLYPSLVDRKKILMVWSLAQMLSSKDRKIRDMIKWFAEEECEFRQIIADADSGFLNWRDEHGRSGTASLVARTRKICADMKIQVKLANDEMIVRTERSEYKTRMAVGIGRF